jgi:hypothetical protein
MVGERAGIGITVCAGSEKLRAPAAFLAAATKMRRAEIIALATIPAFQGKNARGCVFVT